MQKRSFAKKERLLNSADFQRARKFGKKSSTENFLLYIFQRKEEGARRLGMAVSRQTGPAVKRNRIKRLLREFFRLNKALFPESTDVVISAKKTCSPKKYGDVEKELGALLKKINHDKNPFKTPYKRI